LRFNFIFILFCFTMLFLLGVLIFLPSILAHPSYPWNLRQLNLPLIIFLSLVLIGTSCFFVLNRRLLYLLEREDWPALIIYLENRVIRRGRYSPFLLRLLANTYLVLSDFMAVMGLENKCALTRPSLVDANLLLFGTARILGKDYAGALHFFETRKERAPQGIREWARWYHGFALLLNRQYEQAREVFSVLARFSRNRVITALSAYFLFNPLSRFLPDPENELMDTSDLGKERVLKALPRFNDWMRQVNPISREIFAAAIYKYIGETGNWLYEIPGAR